MAWWWWTPVVCLFLYLLLTFSPKFNYFAKFTYLYLAYIFLRYIQGDFFNWSYPKNHKYGKKLKYQNLSSPKIHKCGKKFKYQNWSSPKIHIRH